MIIKKREETLLYKYVEQLQQELTRKMKNDHY